jgi:DNA-binding GntR family transcriptional regulator
MLLMLPEFVGKATDTNRKIVLPYPEKLTNGELSPGVRLVTRTIADEIGVCLGPVREAISRLLVEGLVYYVLGLDASVRNPGSREYS